MCDDKIKMRDKVRYDLYALVQRDFASIFITIYTILIKTVLFSFHKITMRMCNLVN